MTGSPRSGNRGAGPGHLRLWTPWRNWSHTRRQCWLKWFWISLIPVSYFLRNSVAWVVLISHYANIASHQAAQEAAD